jgi:hypothetical protein
VSIERLRVKLSQDVNLLDATVEAVAYWDVYEPVTTTNWDLIFQKIILEHFIHTLLKPEFNRHPSKTREVPFIPTASHNLLIE